ncbi:MAG: hypothetical protein KGI75_01680 [Rhizobiaceae bacterium]|nr:hypothetical protein [Rhizobiaceae bacterium]
MFNNLNLDELQAREDEIFIKAIERKWTLDAMGIIPTHDKAYCFYKWQLDEIDAAKAALETAGLPA